MLWDYGTPTPPTDEPRARTAPRTAHDPHGFGRGNALLLNQITTFLTTGVIPNECGTAGLPERRALTPPSRSRWWWRRPRYGVRYSMSVWYVPFAW